MSKDEEFRTTIGRTLAKHKPTVYEVAAEEQDRKAKAAHRRVLQAEQRRALERRFDIPDEIAAEREIEGRAEARRARDAEIRAASRAKLPPPAPGVKRPGPEDMVTRERAELVARELFPEENPRDLDCACAFCADLRKRWDWRVTLTRLAIIKAFR